MKKDYYWCGFENGCPVRPIHEIKGIEVLSNAPILFVTKAVAKKFFSDVRKVRIVEVKK